ncbi:MAG: DUF378 domain-containing protein [Clostridia bacterium]|nr:DUF378 domain-containing protein [Clostridia bacterium]
MVTLISFILVIIGALNWLSIALFQFDLVASIFGSQADTFARIIYGFIGFASIVLIYAAIKFRGRLNVSGDYDADRELVEMRNDGINRPTDLK